MQEMALVSRCERSYEQVLLGAIKLSIINTDGVD